MLAGTAGWIWNSGACRWARDVAIPQIEQYVDASDWEAAYALAKQVQVRVATNRAGRAVAEVLTAGDDSVRPTGSQSVSALLTRRSR